MLKLKDFDDVRLVEKKNHYSKLHSIVISNKKPHTDGLENPTGLFSIAN
jgi:hypothetical protein